MSLIPAARRCLVIVTSAAALAVSSGCSVPQLVRQTTPAVVDSGLSTLDDPANKRKMRDLVASPEIKQLEKELITGIVDGSLSAMTEQRRAERMGEIAARFTGVFMRGMSNEMTAALANEENARRLQSLVGGVVQASFEPVIKSMGELDVGHTASEAMTKHLGPALQKVLQENLGPGIANAMDHDDVRRALGGMAHAMGKEMVLGANEALTMIQQDQRAKVAEPSLLGNVSLMVDKGPGIMTVVAIAIAVIAAALAVWVGKLLLERKRYRTNAEERAATTRMLNEALRIADGKPWRDDLLSVLEQRFNADDEMMLRLGAQRMRKDGLKPRASASKPNASPPPPQRHISHH